MKRYTNSYDNYAPVVQIRNTIIKQYLMNDTFQSANWLSIEDIMSKKPAIRIDERSSVSVTVTNGLDLRLVFEIPT